MDLLLIVFNAIFMVTCFPIAFLYRKYFPKDINDLIGYRTKRSMVSREHWLFANEFCSKLLLKFAIMTSVLQVVVFFTVNAQVALLSAIVVWILALISTLILTEIALKKRFKYF
jgi:hypothetical protein